MSGNGQESPRRAAQTLRRALKRLGVRRPRFTYQFLLHRALAPVGGIAARLRGHADVWLIDERLASGAQDNGFAFFRYLREVRPDIDARFVISKRAARLFGLRPSRDIVMQGSLRHLLLLHRASVLCSTDTFHALSPPTVHLGARSRTVNVFLQHGVAGNKTLTYQKARHPYLNLVVTTNPREARAFEEVYGFDPCEIALTGIARLDLLPTVRPAHPPRTVLIAPTWRRWLKSSGRFDRTSYARNWTAVLTHPELGRLSREFGLTVEFCPHFNMHRHLSHFGGLPDHVRRLDMRRERMDRLIRRSDLLITDYSSVMYDFFYQAKPVIPFMFDRDAWEAQPPGPPHVDFDVDLGGPIASDPEQVMEQLTEHLRGAPAVPPRAREMSGQRDGRNRARILAAIEAKRARLAR